KFPPDKYGPQTLKDIVDMGIRRQPVPLDVREFADPETQRLWNLALKAQQDAQASEKKEEKKKSPASGGGLEDSDPARIFLPYPAVRPPFLRSRANGL